jgi:hypothetical protein
VSPKRCPEHERRVSALGAPVGGRQRDPAGERGDYRVVVARQVLGVPLAREAVRRERGRPQLALEVALSLGDVARLAAEAEHLDAVALVQQLVERNAVRRKVVGDERN